MASSPSTELQAHGDLALSWMTLGGEPLPAPREWEPAYLVLDQVPEAWDTLELTRNGLALPLSQRRLGGPVRVLGEWPRSNPGQYQLRLSGAYGATLLTVRVEPRKISMASFEQMLADLHERLPADVILSLQQAGGLAGVQVGASRASTFNEEFLRLKRAVQGTPERPGLGRTLPMMARRPHQVLEAHTVSVRSELLKRPRPAALAQTLSRAAALGTQQRPERLPDERVRPTVDVYENRIVGACVEAVDRRLRELAQLLQHRRGAAGLAGQVGALQRELHSARRTAPFLNEVGELRVPPGRVTMVLLKRREYRAVLETLLELQRSLKVSLDGPGLQEPMENLPALYQTWCTLEVVAALLHLAASHGYEVVRERLTRPVHGSLLVQVLPDGEPLLVLLHRPTGTRVSLTSERTFKRGGRPLRSTSFAQRPDLTVEVVSADGQVGLWLLDPKYKLDSEANPEVQQDSAPQGQPKKVDIDKMHAYRDAIRDEHGAHVVRSAAILYPGKDHHYLTGLAALSAIPGREPQLRERLLDHLREAVTPGTLSSA